MLVEIGVSDIKVTGMLARVDKSSIGIYIQLNNKPKQLISLGGPDSTFIVPSLRMKGTLQVIVETISS